MVDIKITGLEELADKFNGMTPEDVAALLKRDTGVFEELTRPRIRADEISITPKQPSHPPFPATYSYGTLGSRRWATVEDVVITLVSIENRCLPPTHVFAPGAAACYCGELASAAEGE